MNLSSVRFLYGGEILFLFILALVLAWAANSNNPRGISWRTEDPVSLAHVSNTPETSQPAHDLNAAAQSQPPAAQEQPLPDAHKGQSEKADALTEKSFLQPSGAVTTVDTQRALALHQDPAVLFIDARYEEDFLTGHIAGALNLPPDMPEETMAARLADSAPERVLVLYCGSAQCLLSHELAQRLSALGRNSVLVYPGGLKEWHEAQGKQEKPL